MVTADKPALPELLATLETIGNDTYDEATRFQLKEASRRVVAKLERPFEKAWSLTFEQSAIFASIQTLIDRGLWVKWREAGPTKTIDELATIDGVMNSALLRRQLRMLATVSVVDEVDVDTFALNKFSEALGAESDVIRMSVQMGSDTVLDANRNLPSFLKKINYVHPIDNVKTNNFADAFGGKDFFAYCAENPAANKSFIDMMHGITAQKMDFSDVFDTSILFKDVELKSGRATFCDIGGGHGLDVERLRAKHAGEIPEKSLYLQDLPNVIEMAKLHPDIEGKPYDFFEPQSLPGARAYFTHAVLHDWPDKDALRILKRIAEACERGYSKVLLYEIVLPSKGASALQAAIDMALMSFLASFERTEAAWHALCEQAGLRIVKIWSHPSAVESVIEAELA